MNWRETASSIYVLKICYTTIMEKTFSLPKGLEIVDGQLFMFRCPKCNKENYVMNVSTGICTWCGYDARPDYQPDFNKQETTEDNGNIE